MRKFALGVMGVCLVMLTPFMVSNPAGASEATARASFQSIYLSSLQQMESGDTGSSRNYEAWISAYQAALTAGRDGWTDPKVTALLNRVYNNRTNTGTVGYGTNFSWDAFQDGTPNDPSVTLTVTTADHVGEPLLEGYKAGAVPQSKLQEIADALWSIPVYKTGSYNTSVPGRCMAYSDSSNDQPAALNANNKYWCVINVSAGAAAMLQKLLDVGVVPTGATTADVQTLISDLGAFADYAYTKGGAGAGYWPYAYRSVDDTYQPGNNPQDLNHNAYTAESMKYLGYSSGTTALNRMNDSTDYTPTDVAGNDLATLLDGRSFNIVGRMRAAGALPSATQKNLLAEAQYHQGLTVNDDKMYSLGQEARWAQRLAQVATADSEVEREVDFMTTPRLYPSSWSGRGSETPTTTIKKDSTYIIYTDARFYDVPGNLQFITALPVKLTRQVNGGSIVNMGVKNSGFDWWGTRWSWVAGAAVGSTVKFCAEASTGQATPFYSNCKTITIS